MSFLSAIAAISLAVMFPVLLSLRKSSVPGTVSFGAACGIATLALAFDLTANITPTWSLAGVSSTSTVIACLLILNGFRLFLGRKSPSGWPLAVALAVIGTVLLLLNHAIGHVSAQTAIGIGLSGLVCLSIGMTIVRHWPKEQAISPYMLFCCMAAFAVAALHALQLANLSTGFGMFENVMDSHIAVTALLAAQILSMPLFFLGIILMLHGRMIANLRHLIAYDDLTGALSRRAFMAKFERMFASAASSGRQTAFMLLDLDRFKQINDAHGHAGGDAALRHFTRTISETLAGRGILGRLGGEEFGVALSGIGRLEAAELADALCTAVRTAPAGTDRGSDIALTVSIGMAMADPGGSLAQIMVQADTALYEAKALGRDRLSVAGTLHATSAASARALAGAAAQMRAAADGSMEPAQPLSNAG
jgi:diguanylate cyclase (GGDEF)-like protein